MENFIFCAVPLKTGIRLGMQFTGIGLIEA